MNSTQTLDSKMPAPLERGFPRRGTPSRMPDWLRQRREAYRVHLADTARRCHAETGVWFLARGAARDKDEQETMAVWGDLLFFGEVESLPGYSEENHRQAVEFWRSWQNLKTGRLYNPLYQDPQNPEVKRHTPGNRGDYSADTINLKYIPNILAKLGAELPLPCKTETHAESGADTFDQLWGEMAQWNSSPAGIFPVTAAWALDAGELDKSPLVEAGMGALVRAYRRDTGMWRPEPLEGFPWGDYQPSSGFKIISRICGYVGMENFPEAVLKAAVDNLIAHQAELHAHPAMARNYAETFAHFLMLGDYRREELLDAMEECLEGFRDVAWWKSTGDACYCLFGSGLVGLFMNWEDLPPGQGFKEWLRFDHGHGLKWRFVADPYGNWVNAIPKKPKETFGHPDYDVQKHGLKVRNRSHWAKKITELVPQQEAMLNLDGEGSILFTLARQPKEPFLTATWSGAYDVSLNGELVKQVRYNLPDVPAGWHIPSDLLRLGQNRVVAKLRGPGKEQKPGAPLAVRVPFLRLGVIDWQ